MSYKKQKNIHSVGEPHQPLGVVPTQIGPYPVTRDARSQIRPYQVTKDPQQPTGSVPAQIKHCPEDPTRGPFVEVEAPVHLPGDYSESNPSIYNSSEFSSSISNSSEYNSSIYNPPEFDCSVSDSSKFNYSIYDSSSPIHCLHKSIPA